jgi:hypothetical protein
MFPAQRRQIYDPDEFSEDESTIDTRYNAFYLPALFSTLHEEATNKQTMEWLQKRIQQDKITKTLCIQEIEVAEFLEFVSYHEAGMSEMCVHFNPSQALYDVDEVIRTTIMRPFHTQSLNKNQPVQVHREAFMPESHPNVEQRNKKRGVWRRFKLWFRTKLLRRRNKLCCDQIKGTNGGHIPISVDRTAPRGRRGARRTSSRGWWRSAPVGKVQYEIVQVVIEIDSDGSHETHSMKQERWKVPRGGISRP